MNASEIKEIIDKIHKVPYKTVLISGPWGVGKTYAVKNALPDASCAISLFGIKAIKDLYHNLFFEIYGKTKKNSVKAASKIVDESLRVLEDFSRTVKKINAVKGVITSLVSEKELLFQGLKKINSPYIIVFDDLERLSSEIDLKEVLGIVEELKKIEKLKIVILVNLDKMEQQSIIFEAYSEKVIDRTYIIDEPSFCVDWQKMGIDDEFATEFVSIHKVKNLRTMQKAQNFYEDVCLNGGIDDLTFLKAVRYLCFGMVVEIVDEIYKQDEKIEYTAKKDLENDYKIARDRLITRIIRNYTSNMWGSLTLLSMLENYYAESKPFDKEVYRAEYNVFLKSKEVSNFYRTELEVRENIANWKEWFSSANNPKELSSYANEIVGWFEVLDEPVDDVVIEYKKELSNILWNFATQKGTDILSLEEYPHYISCEAVAEATKEVVENLREKIVIKYIDELDSSMTMEESFKYSFQLRQCYNNSFYNEIVKNNCLRLLKRESFPIDNMTEEKYHTCYNVLYILRKTNREKYDNFVKELLNECDKMAAYRIRKINEDIDR